MRKSVIGVLTVAALAAAAVVGASAWSGTRVRAHLNGIASGLPAELPLMRITGVREERGLFSSTQTVSLEWGCPVAPAPSPAPASPAASAAPARAPLQFGVRHRIAHGPFPGARDVAAAVIESELFVPAAAQQTPRALARTRVAFGGAYQTQLTVPASTYTSAGGDRMAWQVLRADIEASGWGPGARLRYRWAMPGMSVRVDDGRAAMEMTLDDLKARGEMRVGRPFWLAAGHDDSEVGTVRLSAKGVGPTADRPPVTLSFNGLRSATDTSIDRDLLGLTTRLTGSGAVGDTRVERLEMQTSLRRLHVPAYTALMKEAMNPAMLCADAPGGAPADVSQRLAPLTRALGALLPHDPAFTLDTLAFEMDGQRGELSYAVGVEGVTEADLALPMQSMLTRKARLSGQARLPVPWIRKLLAGLGGERAAMAAQPEMLDALLEQMAGQGLVVRDGDLVASKFEMARGQLSVNGRAVGEAPAGAAAIPQLPGSK